MSITDAIAHACIEFRKFRIPHPTLKRIQTEIEIMRAVGRKAREEWERGGCKGPRIPQQFVAIIGPSGTGKSTCINWYLETVVANEIYDDDEIKPVLHVTLSAQANPKSLGSDILEAYGDPNFEQGSSKSLMRRASEFIDNARTEVVPLDEFHHVINNDRGGATAWSVTETIKKMLIRGAAPLILIGTNDARPILLKNPQFKGRCREPIFLTPLDLSIREEEQMFLDHCGGFDLKLMEHGIFKRLSGLIKGDIPACIFDVSQGLIGVASSTFEAAAVNALRRGAACITRTDLEHAVDTWAIPLGYIDYNPFKRGPSDLRTQKAAA
jgi:energy-coupling factor transporter ATP-binding protein EcfA2